MILTLEVVGEHAAQLGAARSRTFHSIGGTIGRLPDNDWVLPDKYVSGRHALIRYLNGRFFVEDTSTNGVFINSPDARLAKTQSHPLKSGDRLFIDAYEIKVTIDKDAAAEAADKDPLAELREKVERAKKAREVVRSVPPTPKSKPATPADSHDRSNETQWIGLGDLSLPDPPEVPPPPKVVAVVTEAMEAAADEASPAPPKADRLRELLDAVGVGHVDADDEQAFAAAVQDIRNQRAAMDAAMRAAFDAMLAQLDPKRLQEEFDRHMKNGSMLGVPSKLRYWDLYREKFDETTRDTEMAFRKLFGDEFTRAYDSELLRLKSRGQDR